MRFAGIDLVSQPDPSTRNPATVHRQLRAAVDLAVLFEELGFDGYSIGEHHHPPFLSASPFVLLGAIAVSTRHIRLFTATTLLGLHDPVRIAQDAATVDQLSGGRLELIIGGGYGPGLVELFGRDDDQRRAALWENLDLLRLLWSKDSVTWSGTTRPPLENAEVVPKPAQESIRIWYGNSTSRDTADRAARDGAPIFSGNIANPIETYATLVDHYRQRWVHYGRDPADAVVGAGTAGYYCTRRSQDAHARYRPVFEAELRSRPRVVFPTYEDFIERSSALVGSPDEIVDRILRQHERLGHTVMHIRADRRGVTEAQHRESLELFQSDIAPEVRRAVPASPW